MSRVLMAAPDAAAVGVAWERLLDAEAAGERPWPALGAQGHCWRLGDGWLEVLVPEADGPVAQAVAARGAHLFAGGFTTRDPEAFAAHLARHGVTPLRDGERLLLDAAGTGIQGLRLVVEPHDPQPPVGLIDTVYELTDLVADAGRESARAAELFALAAERFEPIESHDYGYRGVLTLFDRARLDRLEIITPNAADTAMARFHRRVGGGLYMCFAVFLHPSALGGMMLGLSRRSYAWTWSGHPERVIRA